MRYILALDQGTTSCRAIVFDRESRIVHCAQREFTQHFPQPGWVEHDAMEIWQTQRAVAIEAMQSTGLSAGDVAAVGITNQRETTVLWDRATGEPVGRAIVWQDRRTAARCDQLRSQGLEPLFQQKTGLVLDAYFAGTKLAWLLEHVPGARERSERGELAFGTIDAWLAFKLTAGRRHITDASNASRTLLYNIHTGAWDAELCEILNVPAAVLPEVVPDAQVYDEIQDPPELAGVTLAGLVGDQQGALMGQMCTEPGLAKNTYGTGCFLLLNTGTTPTTSNNRLLTTVAWRFGDQTQYALEGAIFVAGALVQWLRDGLGIIENAGDIEQLAKGVASSDGVVLVPALAGLGAPHWDQYARGSIFGLTRGTTSAHIARAALEGIALQVADLVDAMERDAGTALAELRVDGGAARDDLLMQIQADLLQKPVVRPVMLESTALGAAYLAGLATGYWQSLEALASHWAIDRRFEPQQPEPWAREMRERWASAIERTRGWARPAGEHA